jgi:hypothetical protein
MRVKSPFFLFLTTLGLFCLLGVSQAVGQKAHSVRLFADVRYYYGHWQWGDFKMIPRAGMAGPNLRLELKEGLLAAFATYLSGDFAAVGAMPLSDPIFNSRKNYELIGNREEFEVGLEFRPWLYAGFALVYKLAQCDLVTDVELNSDQRQYGTGREQVVDEAWGWGVGFLPQVPLKGGLMLRGEFFYFPRFRAKGAGTYQYEMLYNSDRLDERWFGRVGVHGFRTHGELAYALAKIPISFSLGYFYQALVEREPVRDGWLELYMAGQTQVRSWLEDRFHGITVRAGFSF